jgi:hypothetical protein
MPAEVSGEPPAHQAITTRKLPAESRAWLAQLMGRPVPFVALRADGRADRIARRRDADAVATRDAVYFRDGQLAPRSVGGLALLGHELTHVMQLRSMPPSNRENAIGRDRGEAEAMAVERALALLPPAGVGTSGPAASTTSAPPLPPIASSPAPPAAAPVVARAAARGRDVDALPEPRGLSGVDLSFIKDEIYRDLRTRLRVEFERGA